MRHQLTWAPGPLSLGPCEDSGGSLNSKRPSRGCLSPPPGDPEGLLTSLCLWEVIPAMPPLPTWDGPGPGLHTTRCREVHMPACAGGFRKWISGEQQESFVPGTQTASCSRLVWVKAVAQSACCKVRFGL